MAELTYNKWNELPQIEMTSRLKRRQVTGDKLMSVQMAIAKDGMVPLHQHPHEQISHVISGSAMFEAAGEKRRVEAGEVVVVPSNVQHGLVALEDCVVIDVFSPPREDFLQ